MTLQSTTTSRACAHCHAGFTYNPAHPGQLYCQTSCRFAASDSRRPGRDKHAARKAASEDHAVQFIGVDGEGVDVFRTVEVWDDETDQLVMRRVRSHEYVLLSVGSESYHENGEVLSHEGIFRFLYQQKLANPGAAFVGFFLGYDFSQWLKSLPGSRAFSLLHPLGIAKRMPKSSTMKYPFPVYLRNWELDILGMKRLKLRPRVRKVDWPLCTVAHKTTALADECASGRHNKHPYEWMYVCDAGSFFQASLMSVLTGKWAPGTEVVTADEIAILQAGKDNRATAVLGPDMIAYNVLENDVLARLMSTINDGFVAEGVKLKTNQWFGPGQAAQAWMRRIRLPTGDEIRAVVPAWAIEAARQSYYGGWFEIMMHGPVAGTTYSYDINSAYPYAIAQLPCLLHGQWTTGVGKPPTLLRGAYQLVDARVTGRDKYIGVMPHRDEHGRILRPKKTSGWYWQHELDAARRARVLATVSVDRWVRYEPCSCPPPVAAIAGLYQSRLQVRKDSPYGKSKKLVYNSAYGKFAQSVGQPRFSNSVYASLITSHCRTMILDAIATHPSKTAAVAMVATDSVTFLTEHPTLPVDKDELGKWGLTPYENLSLMMPGLYWDDSSRASIRAGDTPSLKSRGVSAKDLCKFVDEIDAQWARLLTEEWVDVDEAPTVEINVEFSVISPKLAMHRDRWEDCGRVQWNQSRKLSANPIGKRGSMVPVAAFGRTVLRSNVYDDVPDEPRSHPYTKTFGAVLENEDHVDDELLTPDGTIAAAYRRVIPQ